MNSDMQALPSETDFIVVGAGIAGLRASVELASAGRVLCLAKQEVTESNTQYAQGGIAAALSDDDEVRLHLEDTLKAGDGLCNEEAARVLVEEGPPRIEELMEWGTEFDRAGARIAFTREGAHSRSRVLHAHGDSTGREIGRALYLKAAALKSIAFLEFEFTTGLLVQDGRLAGVRVLDRAGRLHEIHAGAVLLATGGLGHVYSDTTNPAVATGDGVAMAWRAGAEISDMEFVQFHPTALYLKGAPRFLLSEALRGEGAYLRNLELKRFMPKYHELAELAPRDVVARAITHELELVKRPDAAVYLDLTHLNAERVRQRFPMIYSTCMQYNIDIATELVPVRPAAHYAMGGVRTDLWGRTSVPGLYAAGEVACTGVHGANRLASNSLLEGLVYGARAAHRMREEPRPGNPRPAAATASIPLAGNGQAADIEKFIRKVQALMWQQVGVVRDGKPLQQVVQQLREMQSQLTSSADRRAHEAANILQAGLLIARSALAREESRGAHYRLDHPLKSDVKYRRHSIVSGETIRFE
ncbi:MAG TPA: L-aspartate oxidase [Candidatus Binatia bacterium]|nr:L-aspartate oxidase [Candidatus Binatia bacterium]